MQILKEKRKPTLVFVGIVKLIWTDDQNIKH